MRRLAAIFAGLGLVAAAGLYACRGIVGAATRAVDEAPYVSYTATDEAASYDFMHEEFRARLGLGNNTKLVFGSSELYPASTAGEAHPIALFCGKKHGLDLMPVGRAYCADLWHAIELGAFADDVDATGDNRVVIMLSMQWFTVARTTSDDLGSSFSRGAYDAFMASGRFSDGLKQRVARSLSAYGIDTGAEGTVLGRAVSTVEGWAQKGQKALRLDLAFAGAAASPTLDGLAGKTDDEVNGGCADENTDASADAADDTGAGSDAADGVSAANGAAVSLDWDEVFSQARQEAASNASNNDLGYDQWDWNKGWYEKFLRAGTAWRPFDDGSLFSEDEFADFQTLLDVCREAGIKPLVVVQAVKGASYDQTIYDADARAGYVARVKQMALDAGADVADFSTHDYDALFNRDEAHPSPLGSAYYSRCIYRWFTEGVVDCGE